MSKICKFRIDDVLVMVNIDHSFADHSNISKADMVSSINYQHCHPVYEMFIIKELPLTFFTEDTVTEYTNCALCIPPQFNHHSFRQSDYRILFSFTVPEKSCSEFAEFINIISKETQPFTLKINSSLLRYTEDLNEYFLMPDNFDNEIAECIFKIIFYTLYRLNSTNKRNVPLSNKESYLVKIENIVNYFQNDVELKTVADELCLSTKQTSRIIMKNYGKPLSALMTEKRLKIACLLLKHTESTIAEIVEFIHFPSESYFYSQFKKAYGCTPYKYKKLVAGGMTSVDNKGNNGI